MSEQETPQIQLSAEPNIHGLTNLQILFDEENFVFLIFSGNQVRRYLASPKHAKRMLLLLQQKVSEYESVHGKLETNLPQEAGIQAKETTEGRIGF